MTDSMEKRFLLALVLTMGVVYLYSLLYPPVAPPVPGGVDSALVAVPVPGQVPGQARVPALPQPAPASTPGREVEVSSPLYRYTFSTRGATLRSAELLRYASYVEDGPVQLVPRGAESVLGQRVAVGGRVLDLSELPFRASASSLHLDPEGGPRTLTFTWAGQGIAAEVAYTFDPDEYLVQVRGRITGLSGEAELQTVLGPGLAPHDAPEHAAERELQVVAWNVPEEEIDILPLRKVEGPEAIAGPMAWAGIKDRYFLLAVIPEEGTLTGVAVQDLPDYTFQVEGEERVSPRALATAAQPLAADGAFAYAAYLGPQEHGRLVAAGHQLEEVNPYGYRWLRPVVRPIAAVILWILNELHDNLGIAYGWVLVIFGVMMRVVTWPLNAKAMRAQMRNMEKQPELQARMREVQEKYGDDPPRMQKEMIQVYQEVGLSPLSMLSGCLPMMIPMPVLITLFFVFQAAIEFRGTGFAWLPDLSLRDPFYVLPVFLVVSMFALQWVSIKLSGMEQNPQTQMMLYFMPLMMGVFFWIMPSGLNLYYATTNVASLPQQLLIARERRRAADEKKAREAAEEREKRGPPGRKAKGR